MKPETRERILELGEKRHLLVEELAHRPRGLSWCGDHAQIADEIASLLYHDAVQGFDDLPPLALIATGGFGRRELSPKSDIDVTIVPSDEASQELDGIIRELFRDLHWAYCSVLRLDVGYAYRLVSDAPGLDAKTRTGLMDMRLLAGSFDLFRQLEDALTHTFAAGEFILSKIEERHEAYERYNDTPLVTEPHLKEGAGGLRDFHCANWIGEAIGERASRPTAAYDTVTRIRNLLHYQTGKGQDFFSLSRQDDLAEALGQRREQMISELALAGSELHKEFVRAKQKLQEARFPLSAAALSVRGEVRLMPHSNAGEAAVGVAIATKLGLMVSDLPLLAADSKGGPSVAFAISTGEATLRNLDKCALLEQLVPELVACRTLVPTDAIHRFTVMEHSLRVIRSLDSLGPATFLGDLKASVTDLEPLYLAALLHDVGKIRPDEDHSIAGSEMARRICKRWHLAESVEDSVSWLIREHLTMNRFIRIRDLMHLSTIEEFAEVVKDPERLKMLTLLTWADAASVAPGAWTPAQDTFLRQLYERTLLRLQGEMLQPPEASQTRQRLLRQLRQLPGDETKLQQFVESLPVYYLANTAAEVIRLHMELAERAIAGQPTVEQFTRNDLGATEMTVCTLDSPGLLSRALGVIYAFDLSLLGIRACTTSTGPAVALDVFTVSFSGRPVPPATMAQVSRTLVDVLQQSVSVEEVLSSKGKDPSRRQEIFTYAYLPGTPGILEIHAPRGRGMAFRFSRLITAQGWNIQAARVGQWAGNGAAAFYLLDKDGSSLSPERIDRVMQAIGS